MGLFAGLFGASDKNTTASGVSKDLMNFLKQVDELYMASYSLKSTRDIAKFLTPACRHKLTTVICSINTRYFGDEKYRRTTWSLLEEQSDCYKISKDVKFDNVKVAGKLSIQVASNYKEVWTIMKGNGYLVDSIQAA